MAINLNEIQLKRARKIAFGKFYPAEKNSIFKKSFAYFLYIFFNIKWSIYNFKQSVLLLFEKKKILKNKVKFGLENNNSLKINSVELQRKGYTFITNFFNKDTYNFLLKNFPTDNNFFHTKKITKNYFDCYKYEQHMSLNNIKNIEKNLEFKNFIEFIKEKNFIESLKNLSLLNNNKTYYFKNFVCTFKKEGSFLIPHMDSVYKTVNIENYNFIYWLDGNNDFPSLSAGTGIYKDNNFEYPLLIPNNLKNSCLIYKTSCTGEFYHGFDTVKKDGFAKVFTFQFSDKNN